MNVEQVRVLQSMLKDAQDELRGSDRVLAVAEQELEEAREMRREDAAHVDALTAAVEALGRPFDV